jgi:hypothetical protein
MLSDGTKYFSTHSLFAGFFIGHKTLAGGDDGVAVTAQHRLDVRDTGIHAAAGSAYALEKQFLSGNERYFDVLLGNVSEYFHFFNPSFAYKELAEFLLDPGPRGLAAVAACRLRVAHAGEQIADGVVYVGHWRGKRRGVTLSVVEGLPGGFGDAGNFAVTGEFAEANAADPEEADEAVPAAAEFAAVIDTCGILGSFTRGLCLQEFLESFLLAVDECFAGHE